MKNAKRKFPKIRFNSLSFKFLMIILTVLLFSDLVFFLLTKKYAKPALEKAVQDSLISMASDIENQVQKENEKVFHFLEGLASTEFLRNPENSIQAKTNQLTESLKLDSNYKSISFVAPDGIVYDNGKEFSIA